MFEAKKVIPAVSSGKSFSQGERKSYPPRDIMGKVLKFDTSDTGEGVVYIVEDNPNSPTYRFYKMKVRKAQFDYRLQKLKEKEANGFKRSDSEDAFDVFIINKQMANVIKDKWIVGENAGFEKGGKSIPVDPEFLENPILKDKSRIPEKPIFMAMEINAVSFLKEYNKRKVFYAILTASSYNGMVNNVQAWDEKSSAVKLQVNDKGEGTFTPETEEMLNRFTEVANKNSGAYLGFQIRVLLKDTIKWGTEQDGYRVVQLSLPYISKEVPKDYDDQDGKAPYNRRFTGDDVFDVIADYLEYLPESPAGKKYLKEGQDPLEVFNLELAIFRSYLVSNKTRGFAFNVENKGGFISPQIRMCSYSSFCEEGDETMYVGRNLAVQGILKLSKDKENEEGEKVSVDLVNGIYVNGFSNNVHNLVLASDGKRCLIDDKLKGPEYFPVNSPKNKDEQAGEPASHEDDHNNHFEDEPDF